MSVVNKKLSAKILALPTLLPLCILSVSACTLLPVGNANYIAAQKSASLAQANRDFAQNSGGRTIGETAKDQSLASDVDTAITGKIPTSFHNVTCFDQKILIVGEVPTKADIAKATAAASSVAGVKKVWNYLTVGPNETGDQITADAYLSATTKKRLTDRQMEHQDINSSNIAVSSRKGVVYLIGSSAGSSKQAIEAVMTGMKQTEGVRKVVNLMDQ